MGKSPPVIILKPTCSSTRVASLLEVREESKEAKEALVVHLDCCSEREVIIRGRTHRVTRYEKFTYSRGELVLFSLFDSEIWDTMSALERQLIENPTPRTIRRARRPD